MTELPRWHRETERGGPADLVGVVVGGGYSPDKLIDASEISPQVTTPAMFLALQILSFEIEDIDGVFGARIESLSWQAMAVELHTAGRLIAMMRLTAERHGLLATLDSAVEGALVEFRSLQ